MRGEITHENRPSAYPQHPDRTDDMNIIGLPRDTCPSAEEFLETIALERRSLPNH